MTAGSFHCFVLLFQKLWVDDVASVGNTIVDPLRLRVAGHIVIRGGTRDSHVELAVGEGILRQVMAAALERLSLRLVDSEAVPQAKGKLRPLDLEGLLLVRLNPYFFGMAKKK